MAKSITKSVPRYTLLVEWSEEDGCYVGRCPSLMLGGVHGRDRAKVFKELADAVDEWIDDAKTRGESLPPELAEKKYSGKFVLRTGRELHRLLSLRAHLEG